MVEKERAAIYVRVSTTEQSTDSQEAQLKSFVQQRGWAVYRIYRDKGQPGAKANRPGLDELMQDCRKKKLDIVVVWKFDRFARSLRQLLTALEEFRQRGVGFVSCTESIDTTTPSGELVFQIFGAIAQFERSLISERVKCGLTHARSMGKRLGRPPVCELTAKEIEHLRTERKKKGASLRDLARKYGVTLWMTHQLCKGEEMRVGSGAS